MVVKDTLPQLWLGALSAAGTAEEESDWAFGKDFPTAIPALSVRIWATAPRQPTRTPPIPLWDKTDCSGLLREPLFLPRGIFPLPL